MGIENMGRMVPSANAIEMAMRKGQSKTVQEHVLELEAANAALQLALAAAATRDASFQKALLESANREAALKKALDALQVENNRLKK